MDQTNPDMLRRNHFKEIKSGLNVDQTNPYLLRRLTFQLRPIRSIRSIRSRPEKWSRDENWKNDIKWRLNDIKWRLNEIIVNILIKMAKNNQKVTLHYNFLFFWLKIYIYFFSTKKWPWLHTINFDKILIGWFFGNWNIPLHQFQNT